MILAMKADEQKDIRKKFGVRVRTLRSGMGYSQESFAAACDLHRTYVGAIERGERNVSIDNIACIARALNIAMRDLF